MSVPRILILPGLGNSGPDHWQSHLERADGDNLRVVQDEWDAPRRVDWVARLDEVIGAQERPVVLVAHSSSCALVAHWATQAAASQVARVAGAMLVAPSDPEGPNYPVGPSGFAPVPLDRLSFPSVVVASTNDQYVTIDVARRYASGWGSRLVEIGDAGHINTASGHAEWPEGRAILASLMEPGAGS